MFEAAEKVVTSVAIGIRLDGQGSVCLTKRVHFSPDSQVAAAMGQLGQPKKHPLAGLPAGPFLFAGGGIVSEGLADVWTDLGAAMMKSARGLYGLDDKTVDQVMDAARPMMKRFGGMSFAMGVGEEGEPLYSRMFAVLAVDDAQAYLRVYEEYVQQFQKTTEAAGSPFGMKLAIERAEVDGQSVLVLVFDIPQLSGQVAGAPPLGQLTEKMFGPGGKVRAYLAAADPHTVVMGYTSPDAMRQVLAAAKGSKPQLMDDPLVAKTAKMLPPNAPVLGFWSVAGTMAFGNRAIAVWPPSRSPSPACRRFPMLPP